MIDKSTSCLCTPERLLHNLLGETDRTMNALPMQVNDFANRGETVLSRRTMIPARAAFDPVAEVQFQVGWVFDAVARCGWHLMRLHGLDQVRRDQYKQFLHY